MRRILLFYVVCACLLSTRSDAAPRAAEATTTVQSEQTTVEVDAARIERLERVDLNARMNAVLEAATKNIAGLQKMIDASTNAATTKDLENRMAQAKQGLTIDLLQVQATFAREKGRVTQAEEIDAQIEAILRPKRPAVAPSVSSATRSVTR